MEQSQITPLNMSTNTNRYKHIPSTQAALKLGIRPHTLACWRMKGCGPSYVRLGGPHGRVVYAEEEVAAYLASRTFKSTAEELVSALDAGLAETAAGGV